MSEEFNVLVAPVPVALTTNNDNGARKGQYCLEGKRRIEVMNGLDYHELEYLRMGRLIRVTLGKGNISQDNFCEHQNVAQKKLPSPSDKSRERVCRRSKHLHVVHRAHQEMFTGDRRDWIIPNTSEDVDNGVRSRNQELDELANDMSNMMVAVGSVIDDSVGNEQIDKSPSDQFKEGTKKMKDVVREREKEIANEKRRIELIYDSVAFFKAKKMKDMSSVSEFDEAKYLHG